jgi:hypothetical protein
MTQIWFFILCMFCCTQQMQQVQQNLKCKTLSNTYNKLNNNYYKNILVAKYPFFLEKNFFF